MKFFDLFWFLFSLCYLLATSRSTEGTDAAAPKESSPSKVSATLLNGTSKKSFFDSSNPSLPSQNNNNDDENDDLTCHDSEETLDMLPILREGDLYNEFLLSDQNPIDPDSALEMATVDALVPSSFLNVTEMLSSIWTLLQLLSSPQFYSDTLFYLYSQISFLFSWKFYEKSLAHLSKFFFRPSFYLILTSLLGYFYYLFRVAVPNLHDKKEALFEVFISLNYFFDFLVEFVKIPSGPFVPEVIADFLDSLSSIGAFLQQGSTKK